jgi:hypothetical protein
MIENHGLVDIFETYFRSNRYRFKVFGIRLNALFRIMGKSFETHSNSYLDRIREQYLYVSGDK